MSARKIHIPTTQGNYADYIRSLMQYQDGRALGNVKFVDSVIGTDGAGYGYSPEQPTATIDYTIGLCTANNDDLILVMPGHTETLVAAGSIAADVGGITIRGVGIGRKRPIINYTTLTSASLLVTANNVFLDNLVIRPIGIDAVTTPIDIEATDFTMMNCEVEFADSTNQATIGAINADAGTTAPDRMWIKNNFFHGSNDAGTAKVISWVGGDSVRIEDNYFIGNFTTTIGAIEQVTTLTTNCFVFRNRIVNRTASSAKAMVFTSTSTGMISENMMQILTGSAPITGAAMSWVGNNYYAAVIATLGTLI